MGPESLVDLIPIVLTFLSEIAKALAWPVVAAGTLIYFHRPLRYLLVNFARAARSFERLRIGEVELARTLKPAVDAANSQVEEAKEKLATEQNLTVVERQELLDKLQSASEELERLKQVEKQILGKDGTRLLEAARIGSSAVRERARTICDHAIDLALRDDLTHQQLRELQIPQLNNYLKKALALLESEDSILDALSLRDYLHESGRPTTAFRNLMRTQIKRRTEDHSRLNPEPKSSSPVAPTA